MRFQKMPILLGAKIKRVSIDRVVDKGLKFIGCGGNTSSHIKGFMIENSTFEGQNSSNRAVEILETNLKVVNSSFFSNRVSHCLSVYCRKVDLYMVYQVGGAIFVNKSNASLINCTFSKQQR